MRLPFWRSSSTWRGWQGLGQICKHTPVGCTGLKSATPPMFWPHELIQIFSPPCRRCPVAWTTASAAPPTLAGSSSRGSVCGTAEALCCPQMCTPNEAWDSYYRNQERMELLLVAAYATFTSASDVVPQELYALQLRCSAGDAGQLGLGEVFHQWRTWQGCMGSRGILPIFVEPRLYPSAFRGRPWPAWGEEGARAHRALCGWLESHSSGTLQLGTACIDCGDPTRRVGVCSACFAWRQPCGECGVCRKTLSES